MLGCVVNGPVKRAETDIGITAAAKASIWSICRGITDHHVQDADMIEHIAAGRGEGGGTRAWPPSRRSTPPNVPLEGAMNRRPQQPVASLRRRARRSGGAVGHGRGVKRWSSRSASMSSACGDRCWGGNRNIYLPRRKGWPGRARCDSMSRAERSSPSGYRLLLGARPHPIAKPSP